MPIPPFGAAPAPVKAVKNTDGSITISPTVGTVVASLNTAHANSFSATQTFVDIVASGTTEFNGVTYTWPSTAGTSGYVLSTNGSGTLSWIASSGGAPGGADTDVQYNKSGAFAGSSSLTWTYAATVPQLGITGSLAVSQFVGIGGATTSPNGGSIYDASSPTISTSEGYTQWKMAGTTTISTAQGFTFCSLLSLDQTVTINAGILNFAAIGVNGTITGTTPPDNNYIMFFTPQITISGTIALLAGLYINPGVGSSTNVTRYNAIGVGGGTSTVTTTVGVDIGVSNALGGTNVYAIQAGNYMSFFNGNTTFGSNANPAYAVDVQGSGNSGTLALTESATAATSPASNTKALMQVYKGSGGTNYYLMITWNDGGTVRYKYMLLNGTGTTWTESTTLPT
jgi:hypothetical protein